MAWQTSGVPEAERTAVWALVSATEELERHVRWYRTPDAVRRPAVRLRERSLLEIVLGGNYNEV